MTRLHIPAISRVAAAVLLCAVAASAPSPAVAQNSEVILAQYWETTTFYNPAATGSTDFLRIRGGARLQWVGIDNAPQDFVGMADMPIAIGKQRIGVGAALYQEGIGLFDNLNVGLQASYKIRLFKGTLSVGVQGAYFNQKFKGSKVELPDDDDFHEGTDEAIPTQDVSGSAFDLGAGVWYTRGEWWGGVSGVHLLQPTVRMKIESTSGDSADMEYFETELSRTLYFMAGGNIKLKNTLFELQPSLIVATDFTDVTGIVEFSARYNKFLSLGVGYRYLAGVSVSLGAEFKNFFLGYSYEYPLSAIAKASSGSHEIVAGYQLKLDFSAKNKNRHRSIRLM